MSGWMKILAALLLALAAMPLAAQPAGSGTYRVSLMLYPGDDAAALASQVVSTYRGRLEGAVGEDGTFTIVLGESMAALMARDPHVQSVQNLGAVAEGVAINRGMQADVVTEWKLGDYKYDGSGNIKKIGDDFFVYDSRSRIIRGDAGTGHKQEYTYDGFGNIRTIITDAPSTIASNQTSPYKTSIAVNSKTNRAEYPGTENGQPNTIDPLTNAAYSMAAQYDAVGNVVALQINDNDVFQYDSLDVLTKARIDGAWRSYIYTASDERIGTIARASELGLETGSSWTLRDAGGQVLRRFSKSGSNWTWNEDYIYRGGQLLAAELPGQTKHFHLDHLGTPRLVTGSGGVELSRHTYYPFGWEAGASTSGEKQFTGHERDSPSLDYMHARFFNPNMGRFLSVDPVVDPRALRRPQAWNRYSYVLNNPLRYTDPTGLLWFKLDDKWTYLKDTDEITQVAANKDGTTTTTVIQGVKFGLVFNGTGLTQLREDGTTRTLPAVSGRVSGWGEVHPEQQGDRNRGPIPEGQYSFRPGDIQTMGARDWALGLAKRGAWPGSTFAWGKQRAFLTPSPGTNTRGRSGFSIHGGVQPGSAGCIDLCDMVSVFFGEIPSNAGEIPVDVDYSDPLP